MTAAQAAQRALPDSAPDEAAAAAPLVTGLLGAPPVQGLYLADLLITIRLRWRLLLPTFILPVLLGIAGALMAPVRYTAESVLLVQSSRESAGTPDLTGFGPAVVSVELLKVVRSELEILRSTEVMRRALTQAGLTSIFPDLKDDGEKGMELGVEALKSALRTDADTTSNVLRVSVSLRDRVAALRALEAVIDADLARRAEVFDDASAKILSAEVKRRATEIRGIEDKIQQIRAEYGVLDIARELQLAAGDREDIRQRENRVSEQQAMTQAQLAAAEVALSTQPERVFASVEATNLTSNDATRDTLGRLLQEHESLALLYNANYPRLRALDERIAALRSAIREGSNTVSSVSREVRNPNIELLGQRVVTLRLDEVALERQSAELARQRQQAEVHGVALLAAERGLRDLTRELDGMEAISRQLTAREAGMQVDAEARRKLRSGIQIVQPPTLLAKRSGVSTSLLAGLGIMGGLGLACATALLLTFTRPVLIRPETAERALRLPALGHFGSLEPAARRLQPMPEVEDMAALLRDAQVSGRPARIIQLVGSDPKDQRAELARALAISYARRSGADIALIDLKADGRGHAEALGPASVERECGMPFAAGTVLPNLWMSYDGPACVLTDPRTTLEDLQRLLARLTAAFEIVLVIGAEYTDAYTLRRLAAAVDANVIVLHGERTGGVRARWVRDRVLGAGGALLGFALTGYRRVLPVSGVGGRDRHVPMRRPGAVNK